MRDVSHFAELIKDIPFTMLTTVSADDGSLRSRPMTLQKTEFDGDLWFFCGKSTPPAQDIQENSIVNLAFVDQKSSYISASGRAEIVEDRTKAEELWNPMYKAWFPEGLEDPDLCLLKVSVEQADYWETPSSKLITLVGFAKAIATGKRAGSEIAKHGHLV